MLNATKNRNNSTSDQKTFGRFDTFMKHLIDSQEKIHSEKWKLEESVEYLKCLSPDIVSNEDKD